MKAIVVLYNGNEIRENVLAALVKVLADYDVISADNIKSVNVGTLDDSETLKLCAQAVAKPAKDENKHLMYLTHRYPILLKDIPFTTMFETVKAMEKQCTQESKTDEYTLKNAIAYAIKYSKKSLDYGITSSGMFVLKLVNSRLS